MTPVQAVRQYNAVLRPYPTFHLWDYFGNVNTTDDVTTVTATVVPPYHCGGSGTRIGYLSGVTTVTVQRGVATFRNLSAYCFPQGNITLQFQAQLNGFDAQHAVSARVTLVFRPCRDGELLVNNQCQVTMRIHLHLSVLQLLL